MKINSPHQAKILSLWAKFRPTIIQHFPPNPGLIKATSNYLAEIEELYTKDAYNSLSIEGYQVDSELIQRVHQKNWNFDSIYSEKKNTLAARGYYEAFLEVKRAIIQICEGKSPGTIVVKELQNWFRALFSPSLQAGILQPNDLWDIEEIRFIFATHGIFHFREGYLVMLWMLF